MKKSFLFLALATLLLLAVKAEAQVGFHAGYAPQTLSVSGSTTLSNVESTIRYQGFFGGVHYNFSILDNLDFVAALQIRMNSTNSKSVENGTPYDTQDWQFIAELPLQLGYAFALSENLDLGIFAGPVLSYGISYTQKTTDPVTFEVNNSIDRYNTSSPLSALKRFELNVDGGLFLEYKSFMLYGGYRLGLLDLDKIDNMTTKARGFFVGIGIN